MNGLYEVREGRGEILFIQGSCIPWTNFPRRPFEKEISDLLSTPRGRVDDANSNSLVEGGTKARALRSVWLV